MKIGVPSVEYKSTSAHSLDLIRVSREHAIRLTGANDWLSRQP
jgi:hypothetical protein